MDERDWLADRFEAHRSHLRSVAYRMLGSAGEADDAVQEAWIRLSRSGAADVENLGGWLTTVVSRVCLDMLRSRTARREEPLDPPVHEATPGPGLPDGIDPERAKREWQQWLDAALAQRSRRSGWLSPRCRAPGPRRASGPARRPSNRRFRRSPSRSTRCSESRDPSRPVASSFRRRSGPPARTSALAAGS